MSLVAVSEDILLAAQTFVEVCADLCWGLANPRSHLLHHRLCQQMPTAQAGVRHHSNACCRTRCSQLGFGALWVNLKLQAGSKSTAE